MKKLILSLIALFAAFTLKSQDIVGTWSGTLSVHGHNLRIVFHISKDGETYKATMDSPDQGATGLPVGSVTFEDNRIRMSIAIPQAPPAEYTGELSENTITGTFRQMGMSFPLNLTRGDAGSGGTSGFLHGRLFDSQTREPLLFSSVALINDSDSSLVTGVITDADGRFVLENLRDGHYRLRITNIGYHPFISNTIEMRRGNNRLDLGSFFINPSTTQLTEVEIIATRPVLEQQAGRLIFNVAESTTSVGDNALETLKKFPGVIVDNEENITLNGRNVLVMIDNRETHLSGEQLANLLKSLPAEQIGSIEAIDNPGARFSAEGISGILNIRTRRTRMIGYSGTVFSGARYSNEFNPNAGFDLNFRNNQITVFANFNYSEWGSRAGMDGFTNFPRNEHGDSIRWVVNENENWGVNNSGRNFSGRGGIDYHINNRNNLSLSYRFSQGMQENNGNLFTRMRLITPNNDSIFQSFRQSFDATNEWGNHNLSLNYQHIFDSANNRQFFIDASWVRNIHSGGGRNDVIFFNGDIPPPGTIGDTVPYNLQVRLPSDIFSIRTDLEFPINKETRIEAGARYSFVNNDNTQFLESVLSDRYIYTEHISAAYTTINHKFSPKLSLEAGLRFEYTALEGDNRMVNVQHSRSYPARFQWFPSLNVNQQLTDQTGLNFSYSRRLRRPNYTDLNPIVTRNTAFAFNEGNPNLNPDISHLFRLSYSFNHIPIIRLSYSRTDGEVRRVPEFRGDTTWNRPENLGRNDAVSLNLMYQHTFFNKWRILVNTGGEYSQTQFKYNDSAITREFFNARYFISNDITLSPTMSMDINSWGMFPRRHLFTRNTGMYSVNIGFRKSFFDRKLTATVSLNDIFNTANKWTNDTQLPTGQHEYMASYWASRSINVRVSYRFGKGNVITARQRRDAAAEEAGRMGGGGEGGGQGGGM